MPLRRRPARTAATAWPPSWVTVTISRVRGHTYGTRTSVNATTAMRTTVVGGGTGCTDTARRHTSVMISTALVSIAPG